VGQLAGLERYNVCVFFGGEAFGLAYPMNSMFQQQLVSLVVSPGKGSHDAVPNGPPKVDVPVAAHVDAKTSQG
jgi:hypothetical protein